MKKIGLLAGIGRLPVDFARAARGMGFDVIAIGIVPDIDAELKEVAKSYYGIPAGELDKIITTLKNHQVTEVTMIGKVTKEYLFNGRMSLDERTIRLLASLPDKNDDTIMLAFVRELFLEGMQALDQTMFIKSLMPAAGVLTERAPTEQEAKDMDFGFTMAKHIGGLDIGQTVVVKNSAVMAVEAIEGTDECIKRGGMLGRGGVTVAKVAKPQQDLRFDVPSVGLKTINSMIEAGASALVIEAGRTLFVEREQALSLANRHGITIVAKEQR